MATIPSAEAILLEINQSLGGKSYASTKKNKFSCNSMDIHTQQEMYQELFDVIADKLNLDKDAAKDILKNFCDLGNFYKGVELNIWTGGATKQQISWQLLAYIFIPGIARYMAFWNLDDVTDKGMPGGYFWYLPEIKEKQGKSYLHLPVAQVIDWLLDLLGMPIAELANEYRRNADPNDIKTDKLIRTLYNWSSSENTPNPDKFNEFFPDDLNLDFKGTFEINHSLPHIEQFSAAIAFLKQKYTNVTSIADRLRHEIPMTQEGLLEAILDHKADEATEKRFIELLAIRYAKPSFKMIRQYFLIARMVQDGYIRLHKFLLPNTDKGCTDPSQNKLLQLIMLYKKVYNLTIEAFRLNHSEHAEYHWFEQNIPPILSRLLISITPTYKKEAYKMVAEILTDKFKKAQPTDTLEDIYPYNEKVFVSLTNKFFEQSKKDLNEVNKLEKLDAITKKTILEKALKKEQSFEIMGKFIGIDNLPFQSYKLAIKRLADLAKEPSEKIKVTLWKLHYYLNGNPQRRPSNVSSQVDKLLEEAEQNPTFELWKAPILQYKAKHLLAKNDFDGANKLFREALNTCANYNYGSLRGEIARDLLATEVANKKIIHENHQRYFREMLYYGMQKAAIIGFEDSAVQCAEYFWNTLYKPYPEIETIKPILLKQIEAIYENLLPLLHKGNMEAIKQWLKKAKEFKANLHYVRGDTLLMHWIKGYTNLKNGQTLLQKPIPDSSKNDIYPFQNILKNWKKTTALIVETMPDLLNIVDFKKQSPLMLIAEEGDAPLLRLMLDHGADPNLQDYIGRTALHTAIAGNFNDCVDILLDFSCALDKLVEGGASVLHTCVRAGNIYATKQILKLKPDLKTLTGENKITPLELVRIFLNNSEQHLMLNRHMNSLGKNGPSVEALNELEQILA